jgi:hypothetical protein
MTLRTSPFVTEVKGKTPAPPVVPMKPVPPVVEPVQETKPEGETEAAEAGDQEKEVSEYYGYYGNAKSFADLIKAQKADEAARMIRELAWQFPVLALNIVSDPMAADKAKLIKALSSEFVSLVETALSTISDNSLPDPDYAEAVREVKFEETFEVRPTAFSEIEAKVSEAEGEETPAAVAERTYAVLDVEIIQPGWGNTKDNNYYPREMLERCKDVFVGAKMYETDHNPKDKSTRTWVSTVRTVKGFSESGAPIGEVAIHDPNFATRVRNLEKLGLLPRMECSIYGSGKGREYTEGTRKGFRVEELTEVPNVDWVTRAGAGGRAVSLIENADGGETMTDDQKQTEPAATPEVTPPVATPAEVKNEVKEVKVSETVPPSLEKVKVTELLGASTLPKVSQDRLAAQSFTDEAALTEAINAEIDYVKMVSGSGRPVGLGESESVSDKPTSVQLAEIAAKKTAVNRKHLYPGA